MLLGLLVLHENAMNAMQEPNVLAQTTTRILVSLGLVWVLFWLTLGCNGSLRQVAERIMVVSRVPGRNIRILRGKRVVQEGPGPNYTYFTR